MALLSNMSIERTVGQMGSSSGTGGYRYLGGDGIAVDNDLYKISVDYNPETLAIDDQSRLTFNYSFLQAGDNITIQHIDNQLVISAAMFISQFEDGDKSKYDLACLNLSQAQLDIITINGQIDTINGNINAISGQNGSIAGLDSRIDTLESHDTDYSSRIGTLESHDTDHETRLGAAEGTILAHTGTISDNDTRSRKNEQDISTINGTLETITGYSGDIGNLAERMTAAEGSIGTNADNIAANLLQIQANATDIAAINTAIDTAETGYAARITSVENYANTNRELITALNTRVNTLDPGGAEPGESLADRMDAAEDALDNISSTLDNYQTTLDGIDSQISTISGDLSDLSIDVSTYKTSTNDRLDVLEAFQTEADSDIDSLQDADTSLSGRIDSLEDFQTDADLIITSLEAFQTSAGNRLDALEGYRITDSGNISSLQSTVSGHTTSINTLQSTVANKEDVLSSTYYNPAPEPEYVAVQNNEVFDPDYHYFFQDAPSYSQYYPAIRYLSSEDVYDSSIDYYYYDQSNDQWLSYTYTDAETFASDIEALNLVYFDLSGASSLYVSDGNSGYQSYSGSFDPSETYYTQNAPTYSDRYIPEITPVASGASYDSNTAYFTIDLRGNMNEFTYTDSAGFDSAVASGLFYIANWSAAIVAGIYKQTFSNVTSVFHIPTPYDGMATVSSGIGNRLTISINDTYPLTVTAAACAEASLSFMFSSGDNIECRVTPANDGNGVRGAVYAKYFGSGIVSDPDAPEPSEPSEPSEP